VSTRHASRITRNDAQIGGSLEVGHSSAGSGLTDTITTDAYFKLPSLTTTQMNALTAEEGMLIYNSTAGKEMAYRAGGWGSSDGTAAGSMDAAYNGGATIAVDAGAITLTDSQTTTGGGLLITKSGVVTSSSSASVFHINSTGAHDTSGTLKMFEISVGAETATTIEGIEVEMYEDTDNAILVTKGAVTLTDGGLTMTSGAFTMSSGNADITGTLTVSGTSTLAAIANSGAITSQGQVIIDVDNAEAFLIRENGDAADVVTVDTTQDASDTTMTVSGKTTSGKTLYVDLDTTTGQGVDINAASVTSGDALRIVVASATMTGAGSAISVLDGSTEVFAVRDDGSIYSKATAEGTTAFQIVTGDLVVSDGDFTVGGGESSFTDGISTANVGFAITSSATTAGVGAGTAGPVVITANSLTTGTALVVRTDAITTGDMLYLDAGGATMTLGSGFYINCNDDNSSKFTVSTDGTTVIAGTVAGTAVLTLTAGDLVITDTDASTMSSVNGTTTLLTLDNAGGVIASDAAILSLDAGGAVASGGNLLRVAPTGTPNAGAIGIEYVGASKAMTAMYIDGDPTASSVVAINGGGAMTDGIAVLALTNDGNLATGGNILALTMGGTPHAQACALEITASKDARAVDITSSAATACAVRVTGAGAIADNMALLNLVPTGTPAAAGSNVFRIDASGMTATNKPTLAEIIGVGKDCKALEITADPTTTSGVTIATAAALAADKASLEVISDAVGNADSATVRIEQTNTGGVSPCVNLKQDDVSQAFINFESTAGAGNAIDLTATTQGAIYGFLRVEINGTAKYITVCATPTGP
jgi:hypothetical protein